MAVRSRRIIVRTRVRLARLTSARSRDCAARFKTDFFFFLTLVACPCAIYCSLCVSLKLLTLNEAPAFVKRLVSFWWCPNLLMRTYIAVICAVSACEGSRYVSGGRNHTSLGPVVYPKEILVINGPVYGKEYSKVLEILQFRLHQEFIFSAAGTLSHHFH